MKRLLLGGAAATAVLGIAPALAQTAAQPSPGAVAPAHPDRANWAKPHTRAEVQTRVQGRFARLDANHDGFVTQAEADAAKSQRTDKRKERADKRAERWDPSKIFDRLDANKDGRVTQAEAEAAKSAWAARRGGQPAEAHATAKGNLFANADTNRDGVITRDEFQAAPHRAGDRGGRPDRRAGFARGLFAFSDANKDGKVSLVEAQQAALQKFDQTDLNHDGTITPEERRQARQQFRAQPSPRS